MDETGNSILMFLNGTAMSGLKDHVHIQGSRFLGERRTAPRYRYYSVRDEFPGLVPVDVGGVNVWGELYEIEGPLWRDRLLPNEPKELVLGEVELEDGTRAHVMLLDINRVPPGDKLVEIGSFGGWRAYLEHLEGRRQ
jgi:gamma-glutamylcyclotransferase (GGCT)/AIG2-like uncharacterized protein YtfP